MRILKEICVGEISEIVVITVELRRPIVSIVSCYRF